ncbi:hypothetical protein EW145_g1468 [Phellinidium pouzarii]|uniref:JmjC domain-containing protein n=1 Tax=Phellinidium pouzarii TaxID=167371 RepID=A0A4S4LGA0_9AGAM|nr:hypothetical protein EW145_g1468 [Phellinidium pouzarii]
MSQKRLDLLKRLALEYQELNGLHIETLNQPSPVEFLRIVRIARPTLIKGFRTPALDKWDDDYLIKQMGDRPVSVAVTPSGNADAIVIGEDGIKYFVEPHIECFTMRELLNHLNPSLGGAEVSSEVYYLQSQNGNLYTAQTECDMSEFDALRMDVSREVSWASEALGISPDAVNLWIGDGRSITSVHSERLYPHARYTREVAGSRLRLMPSPSLTPAVRWSSVINPLDSAELPPEAQPLHIILRPGDTLYLPAGWWHHVRQSGVTIALNWWYDMEARGMGWVWLNFLRGESEEIPDGNDGSVVAL